MDLYAVYEVAQGYDGYETIINIWLLETNANKALETQKACIEAVRYDSRYKQWWAEEPLDPYQPNTIKRWRLFDSANRDNFTDYLLEVRVLQTGDDPDAERGNENSKSKATTPKKPKASKTD